MYGLELMGLGAFKPICEMELMYIFPIFPEDDGRILCDVTTSANVETTIVFLGKDNSATVVNGA